MQLKINFISDEYNRKLVFRTYRTHQCDSSFYVINQRNSTFWTAFLTGISIGIPLKFRRRLLFPNSNSYDFFLSKKADDRGILQTEFRSEFFENSGFICFFPIRILMTSLLLTNMDYSLSEKADDRGILQEFRSEKQSTYSTIVRKLKRFIFL